VALNKSQVFGLEILFLESQKFEHHSFDKLTQISKKLCLFEKNKA
jgi:hypothetical protein